MSNGESDSQVTSVNTNEIPWSHVSLQGLEQDLLVKSLINDPETGMMVLKMKYEAGFTNPWHTHRCAHGMYVLEGILETHKGRFGPGEFVWFAEGERMFHGATEHNDVLFLFITNKPFEIEYEQS